MLGGAAGAPLGPLGTVGGSTLGAGAGSTVADLIELAAKRYAPSVADPTVAPEELTGLGPSRRALREMVYESGFTGGITAARPFARRAAQRLAFGSGVEDLAQARYRAGLAEEAGIPLGAEDISDRLRIQFWRKMLGRFPALARPFREADVRKSRAAEAALEEQIDKIAPRVTMAQSGLNLKRAAKKEYQQIKGVIGKEYEDAIELAQTTGARIPMNHTRVKASEIVQEMTGHRPKMEVVTKDGDVNWVPIPRAMKERVVPLTRNLRKIQPDITIDQYRSLVDDVDFVIDFSRRQGFPMKKAVELKKALELDLGDINVPEVRQAFQSANRNWFRMQRLFERPTAQKFGRVDRRIFGLGFEEPTAMEPNTRAFFKSVFDAGSPVAMTDLRRLVGTREFNRAVRAHVDDAFAQAVERVGANDAILNMGVLRRNLGIFNKRSDEYLAMRFALKSTGASIQDLSRLVDVIQVASEQGLIDVSTFIARRATLAGLRGAVRAIVPGSQLMGAGGGAAFGAGVASGKTATVLTALGIMVGLRKLGQVITDPAMVRSLTKAIDTNLPLAQRDAAAVRFFQLSHRRGLSKIIEMAKREFGQHTRHHPARLACCGWKLVQELPEHPNHDGTFAGAVGLLPAG
jgi:hypothetical protein